jgi:hypothetical protein
MSEIIIKRYNKRGRALLIVKDRKVQLRKPQRIKKKKKRNQQSTIFTKEKIILEMELNQIKGKRTCAESKFWTLT